MYSACNAAPQLSAARAATASCSTAEMRFFKSGFSVHQGHDDGLNLRTEQDQLQVHTTGLSFVHGKAAKMATFLEALGCWATTTRASLAAARFLRSLLIGCEAHLSQRSHRLLVTCVAYGVRSFGFCALSLRIRLGEAKRWSRSSERTELLLAARSRARCRWRERE